MQSFLQIPISIGCVYKMRPNDSLIVHQEDSKIYTIIEGTLIVSKCFSNREVFTTDILNIGENIFPKFERTIENNYLYMVQAISTTYILSFSKNTKEVQQKYIARNYFSHKKYLGYKIEEILVHKTIKQRLIHLLLILSQISGIKYGDKVYLSVILSYNTLSYITATTETTIRRIMKILISKSLITYHDERVIINNLVLLSKYTYKKKEIVSLR